MTSASAIAPYRPFVPAQAVLLTDVTPAEATARSLEEVEAEASIGHYVDVYA